MAECYELDYGVDDKRVYFRWPCGLGEDEVQVLGVTEWGLYCSVCAERHVFYRCTCANCERAIWADERVYLCNNCEFHQRYTLT